LLFQVGELLPFERRNSAAAGDAGFAGEIGHDFPS
jgi:hypothetical protein